MFSGCVIFIAKAKRFTSFSPFKSLSTSSSWPSKSFDDRLGVLNLKMGNEGNASVLWWDFCESGLPVIPFVVSNSQQSLPYAEYFAAVTLTFSFCLCACSRLYLCFKQFLIKQPNAAFLGMKE